MDISLKILLTTCFINLAVLLFVVNKKTKEIKNISVIFFCLGLISLIVWSITNYLADTSTTVSKALFFTRASFPPALCMGLAILFFSYFFPITRRRNALTLPLYTFLVIIFSVLSMSSLIVQEIYLLNGVGITDVSVGLAYPGILVLLLLLIIHPTYIFIQGIRTLQGKHKEQVKYVLLGWTTFLSFAITTNAILPFITGSAVWSKFGPLASIFMSISISYAIIRHEFLDIKIIIQKGIIYSLLVSAITALYVLFVFAFEYVSRDENSNTLFISSLLTSIIGVFGVPPLKRYFQKVTDPIFFKDTYDYASVLSELTDILNKNIILETIVDKTRIVFITHLKVSSVDFLFTNETPDNQKINSLLFPITSNEKNVGFLIIGAKKSGDNYSYEDRNLLETFTKQAGIALEKASLYKQVEDYARTLEEKVEERTQEIVTIQKEQETMMLEISHGLQTPLTIMKGELFLMRKQGHDNKRVDTIDASIDRISNFINRFLSLSRLETTVDISMSKINLSSLLTHVMIFFEHEAQEKKVVLSSEIPQDIFINGVREELEELFSNLISNSIKYMRADGPRGISMTLSSDGNNAVITLHDDGIGIKQEYLPSLFKKFYRIKEAETKGISGTGLGLVICKKIVDKHNGTIVVKSTFGKGTTFIITLPCI